MRPFPCYDGNQVRNNSGVGKISLSFHLLKRFAAKLCYSHLLRNLQDYYFFFFNAILCMGEVRDVKSYTCKISTFQQESAS